MTNSKPVVLDAIDAFLKGDAALSFLNHFDEATKAYRERRLPQTDEKRPGMQIAGTLLELSQDHLYLMRITCLKVCRIAQGIRWAINADNLTVYLSLVRSMLEHVAALAFQVSNLKRVEGDLARQDDLPKLMNTINRHRQIVQRLYYGQSPKSANGQLKQFRVEDFREALRKDYPDESSVYDALCEFVHPNHGSNYLVSSGTLGLGILERPTDAYVRELEMANACVVTCLNLADRYARAVSAHLIKIDSRIEIAGRQGDRVTRIFSQKSLAHEGDGNSKETAIYFFKPRTHVEAVGMIYRFLKESEMVATGAKKVMGIDDRFLYEIIETSAGDIWFKTKMDWGD